MDYQARCQLARSTKIGDKWIHRKTGKTVEVVSRVGLYGIGLKHESGKITCKLDHYLAGDYNLVGAVEPEEVPNPAEAPATAQNLPYDERREAAMKAKVGDIWVHLKTGKAVEILKHAPYGSVQLRHASGRISEKSTHYLPGDYSPKAP